MEVELDKTDNGVPYQYPAALLDCRSYDGFSGSACFAEMSATILDGPPMEPVMNPEPMRRPDGTLPKLGAHAHFQGLCGIFVAHYDDPGSAGGAVSHFGIGVMIKSNLIWEALMTDEAQQERAEWDAEHESTKATNHPPLRNAAVQSDRAASEFERFEALARKVVHTRKGVDGDDQ